VCVAIWGGDLFFFREPDGHSGSSGNLRRRGAKSEAELGSCGVLGVAAHLSSEASQAP